MFSSIQNTNEIMCVQLVAVGARSAPAWIPGLGCSEEGNYPAVPQLGCVAAPGKQPLALPPLEPLLTANAGGRLVPSRTNDPESAVRSPLQALPLLPHTEGPLETRERVLSSLGNPLSEPGLLIPPLSSPRLRHASLLHQGDPCFQQMCSPVAGGALGLAATQAGWPWQGCA